MNLLKSKSKLFIFVYGLVSALLLIISLVFMTQYSNVHVAYGMNDGQVEIKEDTTASAGAYQITNEYLSKFLNDGKMETPITEDFDEAKTIIYDFQQSINSFNTFIVVTFVVCIIMFAILLIFSNHSRRVYYIDNLVVGIAAPVFAVTVSIVSLAWLIVLINNFNQHIDLYRVTSILESIDINAKTKRSFINGTVEYNEMIAEHASNLTSLTMVLTLIYYIVVVVAALFVIAHTVLKFNATKTLRKEIIERAKVKKAYE